RIADVERLDESFPYPSPNEYDPEVVFRDSIGVWAGAPEPCRVRVRLSREWSVHAKHHRWHHSQRIAREHSDGSVEVELMVRPCPELEQWILRFGETAEVLEPPELRDRLAAR